MVRRGASGLSRDLAALTVVLAATMLATAAQARSAMREGARPLASARAAAVDTARRLDINELTLDLTNDGLIGFDHRHFAWGLKFPRGALTGVLFSSGLWVGARVGGELRLATADFNSEFAPGAIVGGVPDNPDQPQYRVWKVKAWTGEPSDTAHVERTEEQLAADPTLDRLVHHGWSEYLANAAPYGAPTRFWPLPAPGGGFDLVLGPDVPGHTLLWSVYNDGDGARHTNPSGGTAPLHIEVRQSAFGYAGTGPVANLAFLRWRIVNRSAQPLDSLRVGYWLDPDVGSFVDDFVGSDTTRSLGFAYNAIANDGIYGWNPPALGVDLLDDKFDPIRGRTLGMDAFAGFNEGREPESALASWALMSGASWSGRPPEAGPFDRTGDPLTGQGDLDEFPADRRLLLTRLHGTLAPGDSVDVTAALVVGQGANRLDSFQQMLCADDLAQQIRAGSFSANPPRPAACPPGPQNCPRTADYYAQECATPLGELNDTHLDSLAAMVTRKSVYFTWGPAAGRDTLCAVFHAGPAARAGAEREYAALLSNVYASDAQVAPLNASAIRLDPATFASCSALPARTVGELVELAPTERAFAADYLNLVQQHRRPIEGVPFGLPSFGGGAGRSYEFIGSSLDPATQPDSFTTVRIDFSNVQVQFAHRYLRLEVVGGGSPPGPSFVYAGYHPVAFTARDSVTGEQLEVGFVERCLIDAAGTILPAAQQPATFDSTWSPDISTNGGREYLMVARRPLLGSPRPELAQDDAFFSQPWLYTLYSRRRSAIDHIDDGDAFVFRTSVPVGPGVDARLLALATMPQDDALVLAEYESIRDCLASINRGDWLPESCEEGTPQPPALVSAIADFQRVSLRWSMPRGERETLTRYDPGEDAFRPLGTFDVGASGFVDYEDLDVRPGARYVYTIGPTGFGAPFLQTTVDVPLPASISLSTFLPNPAGPARSVRFTLRSSAPAAFEVLDIAGRSIFRREVGALGPGTHVLPLQVLLAPGVYLMRLEQGGERVSKKGVAIR